MEQLKYWSIDKGASFAIAYSVYSRKRPDSMSTIERKGYPGWKVYHFSGNGAEFADYRRFTVDWDEEKDHYGKLQVTKIV